MKPALIALWLAFFCLLLACSGCVTSKPASTMPLAATAAYAERETISVSLFPSDKAVLGDEAIQRILSSKVELPPNAKVAVMRFPDRTGWGARYYGPYYWSDETYLRLQQGYIDSLSSALLQSQHVTEVTPLPALMTPQDASIPILREAAVRMQADLLLVFRVSTDTYSKYRAFAKDKVKAYSTCELVLLDVRTGLVPFTKVITSEKLEEKTKEDFDLSETMRRAEQAAAMESLTVASKDLVGFISLVSQSD